MASNLEVTGTYGNDVTYASGYGKLLDRPVIGEDGNPTDDKTLLVKVKTSELEFTPYIYHPNHPVSQLSMEYDEMTALANALMTCVLGDEEIVHQLKGAMLEHTASIHDYELTTAPPFEDVVIYASECMLIAPDDIRVVPYDDIYAACAKDSSAYGFSYLVRAANFEEGYSFDIQLLEQAMAEILGPRLEEVCKDIQSNLISLI